MSRSVLFAIALLALPLAFGVPLRPPADEPAHRELAAAVDLLLSAKA